MVWINSYIAPLYHQGTPGSWPFITFCFILLAIFLCSPSCFLGSKVIEFSSSPLIPALNHSVIFFYHSKVSTVPWTGLPGLCLHCLWILYYGPKWKQTKQEINFISTEVRTFLTDEEGRWKSRPLVVEIMMMSRAFGIW